MNRSSPASESSMLKTNVTFSNRHSISASSSAAAGPQLEEGRVQAIDVGHQHDVDLARRVLRPPSAVASAVGSVGTGCLSPAVLAAAVRPRRHRRCSSPGRSARRAVRRRHRRASSPGVGLVVVGSSVSAGFVVGRGLFGRPACRRRLCRVGSASLSNIRLSGLSLPVMRAGQACTARAVGCSSSDRFGLSRDRRKCSAPGSRSAGTTPVSPSIVTSGVNFSGEECSAVIEPG